MKRSVSTIAVAVAVLFFTSSAIYAGGAGTVGGEFLKLGVGARSAGME